MAGNGGTVVVSTGAVADAPGYGQQAHHFYDSVTGLWWCFYFSSAGATWLYATYSADNGATWLTPTNATFTLAHANNGHGIQLGVVHKVIGGHAVVWFAIYYNNIAGTDSITWLRATLSGTTVTWGTETQADSRANATAYSISAPIVLDSANFQVMCNSIYTPVSGSSGVLPATGADNGTTFSTSNAFVGLSISSDARAQAFYPKSTGQVWYFLADSPTDWQNVRSFLSTTGGSVSHDGVTIFGSSLTIDHNDWGSALLTDTDLHVVRYEGAGVFTHRRGNGASFSAGSTIAGQNCKSGAGLAMVTDGTSVWLFIIDTDAANTVRYSVWTAAGPSWSAWTALETSTQVRNFITAYCSPTTHTIAVMWCQANGSNFDLAVEGLALPGGTVGTRGRLPLRTGCRTSGRAA